MFQFDLVDTSGKPLTGLLTDAAELLVFDPNIPDFDLETELAALELGFNPGNRQVMEFWHNEVRPSLASLGRLEPLQDALRKAGTRQERWEWSLERGSFKAGYVPEFDLDELLSYLGEVAYQWLDADDDSVVELARFLVLLRTPAGEALEFELEDGSFEEETKPEPDKLWSGVTRTLYADGVELAQWTEDFVCAIYDPITFESETDVTDYYDQVGIAGQSVLGDFLWQLGLGAREAELDEAAAENAPAPCAPEPDPEGNYGVRYDYTKTDYENGKFTETPTTEVVPYSSFQDAKDAFELARYIVEESWDGEWNGDENWEITLVRRLGALDVLRDKARREAYATTEASALSERQRRLFTRSELPPEGEYYADEKLDVWVPYYDEDEVDE